MRNTQASEDIVEQLPITYNNDELKTQTSKIILRYPLSSSGVPRARHLGQKYSSKRYTIEQRKRNIRNTLPVVKAKNTSYESIQIAVRFLICIDLVVYSLKIRVLNYLN